MNRHRALPVLVWLPCLVLAARPAHAENTPSAEVDEVVVAGTTVARTAGAAQVVDKERLERFEYDDPGAVLQQVPGVTVRGEDGVGLRPNLGIRGANPDRSKKLTLMEDGILFGPAPYSAPAAYYFPLLTRMTQVRVVKGPAAVAYGPQTVAGAIDFLSRPIPAGTHGAVDLAGGDFGYRKAHAWFGSSDEKVGFLVEGVHLGNTGFAELPSGADTGSTRNDWMVKAAYTFDPTAPTRHSVQLKLSYADEVSNETYLGLTDGDLRRAPYRRYAASALDQMRNHRTGIVATHTVDGPDSSYRIRTSAYRFDYARVWRKLNRLGGEGAQTVLANADDPAFGGYHAVLTGASDTSSAADTLYIGPNDRRFVSEGVQSVLSTSVHTGPVAHAFEAGLRLHHDSIRRLHTESAFRMEAGELVPAGQPEITTADGTDASWAAAVHLTDAASFGRLTVTPGARVELITSRSDDRLAKTVDDGLVAAAMPGVGVYYGLLDHLGLLAGVHRGFSPPPPGSPKNVSPERSVAWEAGARFARGRSRAEVIGFLNDYENLTDVCTLASGCVTTNLDRQFDAGRAKVYGLEAAAAHDFRLPAGLRAPVSLAYALTFARFDADFTSQDPIYGVVERGDEIPYVPRNQLNVTAAVEHRRGGVNAAFTHVGRMREQAGSGNLVSTLATDAQSWLDLGGYWRALPWLRVYANLRNATGAAYVVGRRPYGARVNAPRWLQVGVKLDF